MKFFVLTLLLLTACQTDAYKLAVPARQVSPGIEEVALYTRGSDPFYHIRTASGQYTTTPWPVAK